MDNKFVLSHSFNEVVFENRNKRYGAYEIRRKYGRYAIIAAAAAIAFFTGGSLTWAGMVNEDETHRLHVIDVDVNDIPPIGTPTEQEKKEEEKIDQPKDEHVESAAEKGPKSAEITSDIDITKEDVTPPPSHLDAGKDPNGTPGGTGTGPKKDGDCVGCQPPIDSTPPKPVIIEWSNNPPTCDGLDAYLSTNIRYPDMCRETGVEGTVFVQFIVDTKGNYRDVEVVKGAHPSLNAEALRVMKSMPKWTPAKDDNGNLVEYRMRKPIRFMLAK
jgi:protein TonB